MAELIPLGADDNRAVGNMLMVAGAKLQQSVICRSTFIRSQVSNYPQLAITVADWLPHLPSRLRTDLSRLQERSYIQWQSSCVMVLVYSKLS